MTVDKSKWNNPPKSYRVKQIIHNWPEAARTELMDAVNDFGYGGVVTNPSHKNWYEGYRDNMDEFAGILNDLDDRELGYWIYDEKGYPSGYAGGETLKRHPELEAKGFYMRRMVAYEPRHIKFHLDCESDKIVWAAKYPMECPGMHEAFVQFDKMVPVPFTKGFCETSLEEKEAFFVFCVKSAYEGSHCTHNVSSYSRYINIMDPVAVKCFIELMYEPIAERIPDAFSRAVAVFTDEPSLQVRYARGYENWPYALAPWVDGLFEYYEEEYGEALLPYLPLLFEGTTDAYPVRVRFYQLVGKLIAKAYSGQLTEWCAKHGCLFSGHYLAEELMVRHVLDYGSYIEVVSKAGYPGLDVLCCYPEIFDYNTVKYPQMVARKTGAKGMMAELCPFVEVENFKKAPLENMLGVINILYMSGVRMSNSYLSSNFEEYNPKILQGQNGHLHREEARIFNQYIGRLACMLEGVSNKCGTFVYYGIEDVQAKTIPLTTAFSAMDSCMNADVSTTALTKKLLEAGYDFYYADRNDLLEAASTVGQPAISGFEVQNIIIPALDVMYDDAYEALCNLASKGINIFFLDKIPAFGTNAPVLKTNRTDFTASTAEYILNAIEASARGLQVEANESMILKACFEKDGQEMWMVVNNTRQMVEAGLTHTDKDKATAVLYVPMDGSITVIKMGEEIAIPSLQAVFILFL